MTERADAFEFQLPAELVAQAERALRPFVTRKLPRTSALTVALVLAARAWMQRTWDVTVALWPTLLVSALVVLPVLLVAPLLGIASARRARCRIDADGVHSSSLPLLTETVPWERVSAVSLVGDRGFPALEISIRVPLGTPRTKRFPFDPGLVERAAVLAALRRFAPPPLAPVLPARTPR